MGLVRSSRMKAGGVVALSLMLAACGGSSSGGGEPVAQAPAATIVFPPERSLTDEPEIRVSGTATDPQGDSITSVRVNGIEASSDDGFATWQVTVPLESGDTTLVVATEDALGNVEAQADSALLHARALPMLSSPGDNAVAVDPGNNRALVVENFYYGKAVLAFDLTTGERRVVSSWDPVDKLDNVEPVGSGPEFGLGAHVALDTPNNRLLFVSRLKEYLLEVDLATGERKILMRPDQPGSSGPESRLLRSLVPDFENNRLLVMDGFNGDMRLFSMELGSGDRALLSGSGRGDGPGLNYAEAMVLLPEGNRVVVADIRTSGSRLIAINLATGNRQLVSGSGTGEGPGMKYAVSLDYDPISHRFLVADSSQGALFLVNPDSGERQVVSGPVPGSDQIVGQGPAFEIPNGASFLGSQQAVVVDENIEMPMLVDLATGDRQLLPATTMGTGPRMATPLDMAVVGDRWLVADSELNQILSVDPLSGDRAVFLDGATTELDRPVSIAADPGTERAFLADDSAVVRALDLRTRTLSVLSSGEVGSGPELDNPQALRFDPANGRLLVVDGDSDGGRLLAIDPATGDRQAMVDLDGDARAASLALSDDGKTALVLLGSASVMYKVDLDRGKAVVVSGNDPVTGDSVGTEFGLARSVSLLFDEQNNRALVGGDLNSGGTLASVNLTTGVVTDFGNSQDFIGLGIGEATAIMAEGTTGNLLVLDAVVRGIFTVNPANGDYVLRSWAEFSP